MYTQPHHTDIASMKHSLWLMYCCEVKYVVPKGTEPSLQKHDCVSQHTYLHIWYHTAYKDSIGKDSIGKDSIGKQPFVNFYISLSGRDTGVQGVLVPLSFTPFNQVTWGHFVA